MVFLRADVDEGDPGWILQSAEQDLATLLGVPWPDDESLSEHTSSKMTGLVGPKSSSRST